MNKMNSLLISLPLLLISGCCTTQKEAISLPGAAGMEKPVPVLGPERFYPYSKVFKRHGKWWLVKNPDREKFFVTGFRDISLEPGSIYELRMSYVGREKGTFYVYGHEYNDSKYLKGLMLLQTTSYLNVNGLTEYTKKFAVSPESTRMTPVMIFANPGKKGPETQLMIERLEIVRTGTMKSAAPEHRAINLADKCDFEKLPAGEFKNIFKGNGKNAKRWSNIAANVIRKDGKAMLHIVRKKANYIYPWINLRPFPIDPQYHYVRFSFKVKGNGSLRPGLWWKRRIMSFDYYHGPTVTLNGQWQTVTLTHPCMTPDVKQAAISFTSTGDGELFIKDVQVNLL